MIVWSRGLGKQRLPLELPAATLHVKPDMLTMEGNIEPVCWDYAIKLGTPDLADFLKVLAKPETAKFLAERGGLLLPFVLGLIVRAPGLILTLLLRKPAAKGGDDALLV
jgi:hypothetical protein